MYPFSYTAPVYSQEDEERDRADLTAAEKDEILDDVFGRNAEETAERNRREITQEELDDFQAALERIPVSDRAALLLASVECPELLETETAPHLFLRCDGYDVDKAAKRMADYWDMRVDIFGEEKAFLPMTLLGALHGDDDVMRMMRGYPHFRNFLPNDRHGRTVITGYASSSSDEFSSFSRTTKLKYIWYNVHLALRREATIQKGVVVFMSHPRNYKLGLCDRLFYKKLMKATLFCFPFKIRAIHIFEPAKSLVSELVFPVVKYFMSNEMRQRFIIHSGWRDNKDRTLEILQAYGFRDDSLPKSFGATFVGGTYELNEHWVDEELERERELARILEWSTIE